MSSVRKIVNELEINAPAHKYYKIFKEEVFHVPKITPGVIKKVVHDHGDWDKHGHGSIKTWHYTVDDKPEVFKERVEFDDKKLVVTLNGLEGDVFKYYKTFKATYQVVPKGPKHCLAVLTIEYEKLDDGCLCPYKYLDLMKKITKDIESHLK